MIGSVNRALFVQIPIDYLQCSTFEVLLLVPLSVSAIPDTETTNTKHITYFLDYQNSE